MLEGYVLGLPFNQNFHKWSFHLGKDTDKKFWLSKSNSRNFKKILGITTDNKLTIKLSYKKNNLNIGDWSRLSKQEKVLFIAIVNLKFVIARSFRYFFKIVTNKMTKLHEPELINQPPEMYYKKLLLKISQNSQGNTSARFSFLINLQASPYNFIKNRLWHTFFPVNFAKFLRTPVLQNISRLL